MTEERLQEIKDSIEFQYTLAKAKGVDNALLFTNEEEELVEEIERLNKELEFERQIKKEVREYMSNLRWFEMVSNDVDMTLYASTKDFYRDIKEILDKVEKVGEE